MQFQVTCSAVAVSVACLGALGASHESPLTSVQLLFLNLIFDALAALSLATEPPPESALEGPPVDADAPLLTPTMLRHVAGQAAYQVAALTALGAAGPDLLLQLSSLSSSPEAAAAAAVAGGGEEVSRTLVFASLVLCCLFNQINCRRVRDEPDVLEGLSAHRAFLAIVGAELACLAAIVQLGGRVFSTTPLSAPQWGLCAGVGAGTLLVRRALVAAAPLMRS